MAPEPAHDAEVDGDQTAAVVDEQVSRVHVGVKEAVAQRVAQECLDQHAAEFWQVETLRHETGAVGQRRGVDPFQGQHFLGGAVPVDRRHAEIRIVLGVLGHFRERRRLETEIHFDHHRAAQRVDHLDEAEPPRFGDRFSACTRGEGESAEIGVEALFDAGPQNLDRDGACLARSLDRGAMHLRNRGGGDRRAEA